MAQSKMIMPLAVIVIVAVAIVGAYYATRPAAPVTPGVTALSVDTTPVKGGVTVDGVSWGTAPVSQEVDPGTYTVTFGAVTGYTAPATQSVTVASGETKSITVPYVAVTPEKLKVAFALPGYLTDASWNAAMYTAAYELADEMDLDIAISEGMGWGSIDSTLIHYANEGYDIIFAHSAEYQDSVLRVAPDYPEAFFMVDDAYEVLPNVGGYNWKGHEGYYLAGILAGGVSKTGVIGMVAGVEYPSIRANFNAYILGAQTVNPDIEALISFASGRWNDMYLGSELAFAQMELGADVIAGEGDGLTIGVISACEDRNTPASPVYALGYVADMNSMAPFTVLSSMVVDFEIIIRDTVEMYREGTLEGKGYVTGIKENITKLAPFHALDAKVPQEIKDAINQAIEDVTAGTLEIPRIEDYIIET